ncbi:MAG: ATPase [Eubacteriales bacterium]|nr:ATPase [Eubacteriales bacterium]
MQVNSRIEQKIEDIYAFIESCKMQALSSTKVVVPKNELYDLLDDLRRDVPEEIKRYQKILNQRDAILEDAETKASALLLDAKEQYKAMVEEHSIMQQAYQQAEDTIAQANAEADHILETARRQADEIGNGAIYYTTDMLEMAEKTIARAYESTMNNSRALETALRGHLDIIRQNKAELTGVNNAPEEPVAQEAEAAPEGDPEMEAATYEERTEDQYE